MAVAIVVFNKRPALEEEVIGHARDMKRLGWHNFDIGNNDNCRNGFQRNWAEAKIYHKDGWDKRNAAIFIRIKDRPKNRWWVVEDFAERLRREWKDTVSWAK
jgi:hypothetical protein